jgi:hypothetical protein
MGIHGDAVPVIAIGKPGTKALEVYSIQGALANGSTTQVKHKIYSGFEKCKMATSMKEAMTLVALSLHFLFLGIHPTADHNGNAWADDSSEKALAGKWPADGFFGVLYMLKGDLDHFAKMALANYRSNMPCYF